MSNSMSRPEQYVFNKSSFGGLQIPGHLRKADRGFIEIREIPPNCFSLLEPGIVWFSVGWFGLCCGVPWSVLDCLGLSWSVAVAGCLEVTSSSSRGFSEELGEDVRVLDSSRFITNILFNPKIGLTNWKQFPFKHLRTGSNFEIFIDDPARERNEL